MEKNPKKSNDKTKEKRKKRKPQINLSKMKVSQKEIEKNPAKHGLKWQPKETGHLHIRLNHPEGEEEKEVEYPDQPGQADYRSEPAHDNSKAPLDLLS